MTIEPFRLDDRAAFLEMAAAEGWLAESWELAFLLAALPEGCLCMRDSAGNPIAFVTALRHDKSGWIGNLIVAAAFRGQGIGEALFRKALQALQAAGVGTIWLTASNEGKSLYGKYGFKGLDTIVRWSGSGRWGHPGHGRDAGCSESSTTVNLIDYQAWGDRRDALLGATTGRGKLLRGESGFLVIQPCGADVQLGPFSALGSGSAARLYDAALGTVPLGTRIYIDAPLSNRSAGRLFSRRGLQATGSTVLMYAGERPDYRPELLYGLATMGSSG